MGTADNIQQQRSLYGEPLGDLIRRTAGLLGLTQRRTAQILGLSPAMLSHLITGQRVKIANPAALARLQALVELGSLAAGLTTAEIEDRLEAISGQTSGLTATTQSTNETRGPELVRAVLRAVASGREIEEAVAVLTPTAPGLAAAIRAYGLGDDAERREHFRSIEHLL